MNWRFFAKVMLLVVLAVTSSLVTSTVLALGRPKARQTRTGTRRSTPDIPNVGVTVRSEHMPVPNPFPPGMDSHQTITAINVNLATGGLHVTGQAHIWNTRPNRSYLWAVRIRDLGKDADVMESRYDTQLFQVPADTHELRPTFDDTITPNLPPGRYWIQLVIYDLPPGGVATLNDPGFARKPLARNSVMVSVTPGGGIRIGS